MLNAPVPAADTGLPKFQDLPELPAALELALYAALMLTVGTAWAGVLTICWWGIS